QELPRLFRSGAADLSVIRHLVEDTEAAVRHDFAEGTAEETVVAAAVARDRRRLREEHAHERTRCVDELERRARVVLLNDLLRVEREARDARRPALRAVLAHAETVAESAP